MERLEIACIHTASMKNQAAQMERQAVQLRTQNKILPLFQKEVYTLLRETYLKTPDDYGDSNCIIEN